MSTARYLLQGRLADGKLFKARASGDGLYQAVQALVTMLAKSASAKIINDESERVIIRRLSDTEKAEVVLSSPRKRERTAKKGGK